MGARQREKRLTMVECCGLPGRRVVARRAIGIEPVEHVTGIGYGVVVALVAGHALSRRAGVAGLVALCACDREVCARERKRRQVVIEIRRFPRVGIVASGAIVREITATMVGIACRHEVALMTHEALGGRAGEARTVAIHATHRCMRSGQWEAGLIVVVVRRFPCRSRVALRAIVIKSTREMIRIERGGVVSLMAREAVHRCTSESILVALIAVNRDMCAGQFEF